MNYRFELNENIIQWAFNCLLSLGYTLKSNTPENVQITPWSCVVRFSTTDGDIYLKQTPHLLSLEATIIKILHDEFDASVPTVIAHNTEYDCFLMKDAGLKLRDVLKSQFDSELLCKAIEQFTSLQIIIADHVDVFMNVGVPDWRLDKLPDLYNELLTQKALLIEDGLSEFEISELHSLSPKVSNLCQKLSHYSIKQTMVQPDFNDNNTLIDDSLEKFTIIDLGEIVISHPFFSLLNYLWQIKKHHGLTDEDTAYLQVMDAGLKHFMKFETKKHLLDALEISKIVWCVYDTLSQYRLMIACGKDKIMSIQRGRLSNSLKKLIATC